MIKHSTGTGATSRTSGPRVLRHTRRVEMIGGRNNWRTHVPRRPVGPVQSMHDEPFPAWAAWLVLFVVAAFGLPVIMGGWK